MENLAVITALYHSGSFRNRLLGFKKKVKMLFTSQGRSVLREIVPSVLRYPRPRAQFFSQYGPTLAGE